MNNQFAGLQAALNDAVNAYDPLAGDKLPMWADYVEDLTGYLRRHGMREQELTPLADLQQALRFGVKDQDLEREIEDVVDGRAGTPPPSDAILARASAVIDLLVLEGKTVDEAAQTVIRKLMAAGINPPGPGSDSRGWKRLVDWRKRLRGGAINPAVVTEYRRFRTAVAEIPTRERLNRVLSERLWDRRAR